MTFSGLLSLLGRWSVNTEYDAKTESDWSMLPGIYTYIFMYSDQNSCSDIKPGDECGKRIMPKSKRHVIVRLGQA